ncbi:YndM family protein [Anaerobacillus sp. MEB173]|uniref:YndM family protein n=1 Tax=Anaerobacillus sp. MEB173 TaxID=3383345 RepID=UPI003F90CF3D
MDWMNHVKPFLIKLLIITAINVTVLPIAVGATLVDIIIISLIVTPIAYFVGDLFIMPRVGNAIASILDFGLTFLMLWILGLIFFADRNSSILLATLFTTFFITLSEPLFHAYLKNKLFNEKEDKRSTIIPNYSTEFAEDDVIELDKHRSKKDERTK